MRIFHLVLQAIWLFLGFFCLYMTYRFWGLGGTNKNSYIFLVLSAIAFFMALFRYRNSNKYLERKKRMLEEQKRMQAKLDEKIDKDLEEEKESTLQR